MRTQRQRNLSRPTAPACVDLHLVRVRVRVRGGGSLVGLSPYLLGLWCYLQVDSVRIEMNCRTSWCPRIGVGTPCPTHTRGNLAESSV